MYHCRNLKHPETQKERKTNTYRRSWWRHWDNRKSCGETNFVHIFIPSVHFKQKSEVSAQKLSSQRLQRLFPILHEKGSFYSRTAIRSKQTNYANFQKKKKRVYSEYLKKKNSAKDRLGIHCPVSCMMLKVVNLHQKPRKNRSQRKLELKYQGKYPQNRTKNHSTNPMPFFLARPTEKLYRNGLVWHCNISNS